MLHTSLYLDLLDYETLLPLDGSDIAKTRHSWSHDGCPVAVDLYDGHLRAGRG